MNREIYEIFELYLNIDLVEIIISNSTKKEEISKIKIRPILLKEQLVFQISEQRKEQIFHTNCTANKVLQLLDIWFSGLFKQVELKGKTKQAVILISKKGKVTISEKKIQSSEKQIPFNHNREKQYILKEGILVPFLLDLGVMTKEGKVVKQKYDKFKQINRFLELIEDSLPALDKEKELLIIDFGCGKSYLTFAMYYYLKELRNYKIKVIGLDLKEAIIKKCNYLSEQYGYDNLTFLHGDIASFEKVQQVDMVVTLHACDTATDYALQKAILWNAAVILSVPCCQHELNKQLDADILQPIFQYGLIKERMAALITDAMRANLLEEYGYKTQILEFIDMEQTPKNILIRGIKEKNRKNNRRKSNKNKECMKFFHITPTLYQLFDNKKDDEN